MLNIVLGCVLLVVLRHYAAPGWLRAAVVLAARDLGRAPGLAAAVIEQLRLDDAPAAADPLSLERAPRRGPEILAGWQRDGLVWWWQREGNRKAYHIMDVPDGPEYAYLWPSLRFGTAEEAEAAGYTIQCRTGTCEELWKQRDRPGSRWRTGGRVRG